MHDVPARAAIPGSLVLLRHGESVGNARELFTGVLDVDLTPDGEQSSRDAGARLAGLGMVPDLVVTSELARGWRTAELVVEALGPDRPVMRTWRLNERSYGALSGHLKSEIRARHGEELFRYWRRSLDGRPPALDRRTLELWARLAPFDRLPAEALVATESLADVVARLEPWMEDLWTELRAGHDVLVVAHGNSLRALCAILDGLTDAELTALNIPNARPLCYEFVEDDGGAPRPVVRGGTYLDPDIARLEAAVIARQGGT
ncbi:2,3-bisphosphoglycerate-dependent phosphoglycerate mutase [Georgenia alba]|uniref:2,3-bisphosphoglycerate-dependent phosphoglycerate mutase n=1 Tax=Georgenia alba TaxID=2233858 RepID=A0ABW2Q291_9MICO